MTILDQIRELVDYTPLTKSTRNGLECRVVDLAHSLDGAVAFELEECRVETCDAGRVLVGSRGRCLISGTLGEKACVDETSALRDISGPVRVTVIVQPAEPEMQPETALDWVAEARRTLGGIRKEPMGDVEAGIVSALEQLCKALETRP